MRLQGAISQKTVIFILVDVRSLNFTTIKSISKSAWTQCEAFAWEEIHMSGEHKQASILH
jgi:hypothetical protein